VQELVGLLGSELSKREREKRWREWEKRQEEKKRQADEAERRRLEEQERSARVFFEWFNSLSQEEQDAFLREQKRRPGAQQQGGPEPIDVKFVPSAPGPSSYSPSSPSGSFGPGYPLPQYSPVQPTPAFAFTLTEREGQLLVIGLIASIILMISNK
jgi:hypothetical protein